MRKSKKSIISNNMKSTIPADFYHKSSTEINSPVYPNIYMHNHYNRPAYTNYFIESYPSNLKHKNEREHDEKPITLNDGTVVYPSKGNVNFCTIV